MTWKRSDMIAAGSLGVAFLALLYGPVKDFIVEQNKPLVTMQVNRVNERGEPLDVGSSPRTDRTDTAARFEYIKVKGNTENLPADEDLWIILRPEADGRFYPVTRVSIREDGTWALPGNGVYLPKPGRYGVFAYLATSRSSSELASWDAKEERKPPEQYEGMPSLPPELVLKGSNSVWRP